MTRKPTYFPLNSRNVDLTGEKKRKALEAASTVYANRFAFLSMMAYSNFQEVSDMIEESPHYKGQKKYLLNKCRQFFGKYWKRQEQRQGDGWPLYIDFANSCYKIAEPDIDIFFYSIKRALDKMKIPQSEFVAALLMTQELIRICADFYDDFWEIAAKKTGFEDINQDYRYSNFRPILNIYNELVNALVSNDKRIISVLDYDTDSRNALRAILGKAEDDRNLNKAGAEAMRLNVEHNKECANALQTIEQRKRELEKEAIINKLSEKYKVIKKKQPCDT